MAERTYHGAVFGVEGSYGIFFPDFPGSPSQGATLAEVATMGRDALQGHIEVAVDYGERIPDPSVVSLEGAAALFDDEEDMADEPWITVVPITVDVPEQRDRVRIDVPRALADEVRSLDPNLGQFIERAARHELARLKQTA